MGVVPVALDEDEIGRRHVGEQLVEIGFRRRRLIRASMPSGWPMRPELQQRRRRSMAVRILSRLVDIEDMVGVLDGGNRVAEAGDMGDQTRPATWSCRCRSNPPGR